MCVHMCIAMVQTQGLAQAGQALYHRTVPLVSTKTILSWKTQTFLNFKIYYNAPVIKTMW
jgi:hypothetical protein